MTQLYTIDSAYDGTVGYRAVDLLGVGEFADRCRPVLKKSTIYVYKSNGKLPKPDLVVNGGNTALWLDSTVDRWNEER